MWYQRNYPVLRCCMPYLSPPLLHLLFVDGGKGVAVVDYDLLLIMYTFAVCPITSMPGMPWEHLPTCRHRVVIPHSFLFRSASVLVCVLFTSPQHWRTVSHSARLPWRPNFATLLLLTPVLPPYTVYMLPVCYEPTEQTGSSGIVTVASFYPSYLQLLPDCAHVTLVVVAW